uniref:Uncharacterized protein n=1 Tax=Sphingobacterium sp. (strain 21) TaxID=743722 RepID=F4CD61_SPHS2
MLKNVKFNRKYSFYFKIFKKNKKKLQKIGPTSIRTPLKILNVTFLFTVSSFVSMLKNLSTNHQNKKGLSQMESPSTGYKYLY